jgi:diacylglycerol O-acyltransferase / wax synthase
VNNVPGPQIPLYVLGRTLVDLFPMAPLARRQALCIAVMSYNGKMNFGLLGDFDAMPDMRLVADGIQESLDELRVAAGLRKRRRPARRPAAARRTAAATRSGRNGNSR